MSARINTASRVREIRPGVSSEPPIDSEVSLKDKIQNVLLRTGNIVSAGNRWNLKPHKLRQLGLATLAAGAVYPTYIAEHKVEEHLVGGVEYLSGTAIPDSKQHLDPKKYELKAIPAEGAFTFAKEVDPNHDPRSDVFQFTAQLGHDPAPGDVVAVPNPSPDQSPTK